MYNNGGGLLVGIGATGTTVLASTGSSLSWIAYSVAAASIVIGGLLALRTRMIKRGALGSAGPQAVAAGADAGSEIP